MMSLPFFLVVCSVIAALLGRRRVAVGFWALGLVTLLVLFRLHATDTLNIIL